MDYFVSLHTISLFYLAVVECVHFHYFDDGIYDHLNVRVTLTKIVSHEHEIKALI